MYDTFWLLLTIRVQLATHDTKRNNCINVVYIYMDAQFIFAHKIDLSIQAHAFISKDQLSPNFLSGNVSILVFLACKSTE